MNSTKRDRERARKEKVADRAARRDERKARAAERAAAGHVGPPIGEPIQPDDFEPTLSEEPVADADVGRRDRSAAANGSASPSRERSTGGRLYVGNLSYDTDADALRELFAPLGEVTDVHVVTDRDTGRPRGFAFVTMGSAADAKKAIDELDGAMVDGRNLRVNEAEERQRRGGGGGRGRF